MRKGVIWKNVIVAALFVALLVVPAQAAAQPSVVQSGTRICLGNSDTVSFSNSVTAGDTLVVIVGGQGYRGSASAVTGVSDPVNGAWTEVANTGSITRDNIHYRSFAVYDVMSSKAASGGLSITIQSTSGQTAPSAVAVEVKGSVDVSTFQTTTHVSSDGVLTAPPAPAGDLALGLFSIYQYQQSIAAGSGWTVDGAALNCSAALAEHQTLTATASPTVDVGSVTRYVAGTIAFNSGGPPPPPVPPTNTALPVISGTPQQGDTLTARQGTWMGTAPISYSYVWSDGTTGSTDTLAAGDIGQNISVTVTATNSAGSANATSASVGPVTATPPPPTPPSNTVAPAISGTPEQGDTLTATTGTWIGTAPITYTYLWSDGSTGASDTMTASNVGKNVSVTVTGTNAAGSTSATSSSVGPVTASPPPPVPPSNTALPSISGTAEQGDLLTASDGTWTGDTPMTFSYAWSDGATGQADALGASDVGQNISVTVTATNDAGSVSATSASVGPVTASPPPPSPPSNTQLPVISGTPQQDDTLTVSNGSWTGSPTTYTYSWSDGTTGSSDTLSAADVGQTITATVTASNSAGAGLPAMSAGVGPVTAAGPPPPPPIGSGQSFVNDLAWAQSQVPITSSAIPWNGITQMVLFSLSSCTTTVTARARR